MLSTSQTGHYGVLHPGLENKWDIMEETASGEDVEDCPWGGFEPATISFCEEQLCAWITQPSNTWSNLAFVFAGIYMIKLARRSQQSHLLLIGPSAIFLGFGSWMFHMSSAFVFEIFDLLGMFLISGLMVALNVHRWFRLSTAPVVILYLIMTLASVVFMLIWKPAGIPIFAIQLAIALTFEMLLHIRGDAINYKHFLLMCLAFGVSFGIWIGDMTGVLCDPQNHIITGHAVWHVLNAVAIYQIYKFYEQFTLADTTEVSHEN